MLEETQGESESHQSALRDCQDMLEELQTFSQGRETRLQMLQQELQVALCMFICVQSQCQHHTLCYMQLSIATRQITVFDTDA